MPHPRLNPLRGARESSTTVNASTFFRCLSRFELRKSPHAREMRGRFGMTVQREPRQVFDLRLDRREKAGAVTLEEGDRDAVAIKHTVARNCCKLRPRRQNAGEIKRIGARDRDETVVRRATPDRTQGCHCLGKSELFAGEACDETA